MIEDNLPHGFENQLQYGMPAWVVPHSIFPAGYHCKPSEPLPFIQIAAQKKHIALYHMGLYADEQLLQWWREAYANRVATKLDMGKSCIRWVKPEQIPFELVAELCQKMTPQEWIALYQKQFLKK